LICGIVWRSRHVAAVVCAAIGVVAGLVAAAVANAGERLFVSSHGLSARTYTINSCGPAEADGERGTFCTTAGFPPTRPRIPVHPGGRVRIRIAYSASRVEWRFVRIGAARDERGPAYEGVAVSNDGRATVHLPGEVFEDRWDLVLPETIAPSGADAIELIPYLRTFPEGGALFRVDIRRHRHRVQPLGPFSLVAASHGTAARTHTVNSCSTDGCTGAGFPVTRPRIPVHRGGRVAIRFGRPMARIEWRLVRVAEREEPGGPFFEGVARDAEGLRWDLTLPHDVTPARANVIEIMAFGRLHPSVGPNFRIDIRWHPHEAPTPSSASGAGGRAKPSSSWELDDWVFAGGALGAASFAALILISWLTSRRRGGVRAV
jgi:hypothetical protein